MADTQRPVDAYARATQEQRSRIAQAFIDRFKQQADPMSRRFAKVDPWTATPQELAEMHTYAAQYLPDLLEEVLHHPSITGALAGFAAQEIERHVTGA